jgi:hypothetical protein
MSSVPNADYFLEKADQCFLLCRSDNDLRSHLEEMAYEFLAKAVELDTIRDRMERSQAYEPVMLSLLRLFGDRPQPWEYCGGGSGHTSRRDSGRVC